MDAEQIFQIVNLIALIAWIGLLFFPRWKVTQIVVISGLVSLVFSIVYLVLFIYNVGGSDFDPESFQTLSGLSSMFGSSEAVLVGWVHYLAFDLFVGMWISEDAKKKKIAHWKVFVPLLFTFMAGPIGLLIYFLIRALATKEIIHKNF